MSPQTHRALIQGPPGPGELLAWSWPPAWRWSEGSPNAADSPLPHRVGAPPPPLVFSLLLCVFVREGTNCPSSWLEQAHRMLCPQPYSSGPTHDCCDKAWSSRPDQDTCHKGVSVSPEKPTGTPGFSTRLPAPQMRISGYADKDNSVSAKELASPLDQATKAGSLARSTFHHGC